VRSFAPRVEAASVAGVATRPAKICFSRWRAFAWCIAAFGVHALLGAAPFRAGAWPLDVTLTPDRPIVMLGEPAWLSFTVKNLSQENLRILVGGDYGNELGRPSSFEIKTTRSDGKWVSQPDVGLSSGGLVGPELLPAGGTYVFRLFMPHWATFTETGRYTIACRRTLQLLRAADAAEFRTRPTVDVVADVRTTLTLEPRDADAMGRLIAELGETMLRAGGEKPGDEAVITLSWIDDARVVPYFRRAFALRSYALKFIAVQVLARFATDEALAGLEAAMQTRPEDFDAEAGDGRMELATKIRATTAGALNRSKHPRAREALVAYRADTAESVRLAVLPALARLPADRAIPLVQEMTRDPSAQVSEAAKHYLTALWRATPAEAVGAGRSR
jgi:hypothetical protein